MKSYTAKGHTFTVDELQKPNPYLLADGNFAEGCEFKFFAFNNAKFQYELDQLSPDERAVRLEENERFNRKMQGGL